MIPRRHLLAAGVGAAAAIGGAVWWARGDGSAGVPDGFWDLRFARPARGEIALAELRGAPLLLNFWATWCEPCIAEMPMLDAFHARQRAAGWRVLGLAVDNAAPVVAFLARQPVGFDIALAGFEGVGLARGLGNNQGALPFTVVFDRAGRVAARKLGALKPADLDAYAAGKG